MIYKPHDYQQYAKNFILEHKEAAIILEMGLGKTVITLTAIDELIRDRFEIGKVLVIAPIRVTYSWVNELKKWDHLQDLTWSLAVGDAKTRKKALSSPADIYLINRDNIPWLVEESGIAFDFDMIVIDELSSFKNGGSKRFKALRKVRPRVKRIVGLTGTPSSNGLMDLWAEYALLDKGARLGRFISHYRDEFFVPDKRNGPVIYNYRLRPGAEDLTSV